MEQNIRLTASADDVNPVASPEATLAADPTANEIMGTSPAAEGENLVSTTQASNGMPIQNTEGIASTVKKQETDLSMVWIAGGVALAVVLVAAVVSLLLRRRSKKKVAKMDKTAIDDVVTPPAGNGQYEIGYAQTIGARENQEDSFGFVYPKPQQGDVEKLMAVVCDGMGGLDDGQVASNNAVKVFTNGIEEELRNNTPQTSLLNLCARAQNTVLAHNHKTNSTTGCTLVGVIAKEGKLSFISVGDSRISLYRNRALLQLNREHVLGHEMDEKFAFQGTGLNDPVRRRAITSHIGKETFSKVDRNVTPLQLMHGDKVLLMSDGLFGALSEDEILRELSAPAQQAATRLIQAVNAKQLPGQDNATIVIVSYP